MANKKILITHPAVMGHHCFMLSTIFNPLWLCCYSLPIPKGNIFPFSCYAALERAIHWKSVC